MKKQCEMNTKVLHVLLDIIHDENLPINIDVGAERWDYNGDKTTNVLLEYDIANSSLVNETICRAINLTFDLTDD